MNDETMYTLGQITRCAFPEGASQDLIDILLSRPATGLGHLMQSSADQSGDDFLRLMNRLPDDFDDPESGVKRQQRGAFWLGYYQWAGAVDHPVSFGPEELAATGQVLYGNRWQTNLAYDLGVDPRRIRQWMSASKAEKRPIPVGVWSDLAELLRQRGLAALALSSQLDAGTTDKA